MDADNKSSTTGAPPPTDPETRDLLARLLQDDPGAWRTMVNDYSRLLLAIAGRTFNSYGYPATPQDQEDVVAEVWKNVLDHDRQILRRCLGQGFFLQTLHVLARRRAIDLMRARKIKTEPFNDTMGGAAPAPTTNVPALDPVLVRQALAALAPREHTVVNLFFLQDKSYREISALTGMPQNSIGPTLARALAKLRRLL